MLMRMFTPLLCLLAWLPALAGITIEGSRVIYEESAGETTVHMRYLGDVPVLLQVWLDQAGQAPGAEAVPFILTPAVTRIEPGNGQTIRILRTRDGLPQDRESLFYFNTLEVPPTPVEKIAAGEPYVQFSIGGKLKFFYRPKGLPVNPNKAWEMLQFSIAGPLPDGRVQVRIRNASPYHVTISNLTLRREKEPAQAPALLVFNHTSMAERMVSPMGELLMPLEWDALPAGSALPANLEVEYTVINDAGGHQTRHQRLG